jgi:hypothetical protein
VLQAVLSCSLPLEGIQDLISLSHALKGLFDELTHVSGSVYASAYVSSPILSYILSRDSGNEEVLVEIKLVRSSSRQEHRSHFPGTSMCIFLWPLSLYFFPKPIKLSCYCTMLTALCALCDRLSASKVLCKVKSWFRLLLSTSRNSPVK